MSRSTDPVYLRVLEDLRMRITEGVLEPGARVPSRNAIITRYGVGETAAKHALAVLAAEGLIEPRAGSGSYVRKVPAPCELEHDRLYFPGSPFGIDEAGDGQPQDAVPAGQQQPAARYVSWEHHTERIVPPLSVARRLGVTGRQAGMSPGTAAAPSPALVTATRYRMTADGQPVQLATSYEPAGLTEGTAVALPEHGGYAGRGVIERMRVIGIEVDQVVEEMAVRRSLLAEAAALTMPAGSAVIVIERTHLAGGVPVETADIIIPAERYRLRYRFGVPGPAA